jgi:uncharacterized damage-inducible protein DinB
MVLTRNVRMLARYSAWANARLFAALSAFSDAGAEQSRAAQLEGMLKTLNHAYFVDLIWKAHLEGKPHGFSSRTPDVPLPLHELRVAQEEADRWYVQYANHLSDAAHEEVVQFKFVDGGAGELSRGDMLLHIVNHKTYHRGYVAEMLYRAESRPPVMDLPVFLRDAPPSL